MKNQHNKTGGGLKFISDKFLEWAFSKYWIPKIFYDIAWYFNKE